MARAAEKRTRAKPLEHWNALDRLLTEGDIDRRKRRGWYVAYLGGGMIGYEYWRAGKGGGLHIVNVTQFMVMYHDRQLPSGVMKHIDALLAN